MAYVVDRVDASDYKPDAVGEFHGLELAGSSPKALDVSLWRSDPAVYDYLFAADEAFHVVEGAATIELPDTGETIEVRAGDVAYFSAGTRSIWTITEPFKKFVVMSG
jgi:uncharacterized protein